MRLRDDFLLALLFLELCVFVPLIAGVIGRAAWYGKPKSWSSLIYFLAYLVCLAPILLLAEYKRTIGGKLLQVVELQSIVALFGVAGGCALGTLLYRRGSLVRVIFAFLRKGSLNSSD